ncbi:MATE family efflux transporter [Nocardiopsis lambiniae]|uniref:Probable multidrug resistance protein NorM n=1 Tax=Nocardiopsis lambiniae TaxID=3075539 RepID=A0ABU2M7S3_9ACTN|nr:MATE family efflux transporter [Nocardiopsis sp. DSM 44743]MDT0328633.1 MATE family efflux transporter [Nocardiopsis sp. DSM 44743]
MAPLAERARALGGKALPLYFSMLAGMAGTMVTAGVIGNVATADLAAYALVITVFAPMLMVVQGALRGSMPFIAENEDDPAALAPVVRDSTWLALVLGGAGGVVLALTPLWARAIGVAEPTLVALGTVPPMLVGLGMIASAFKTSVTVLLIGLGRNRSVMGLSLVDTALAITVTPVLVLGAGPVPGLGLTGAALAMAVNGCVMAALSLYVSRRRTVLRGRPVGPGAPVWAGVVKIARVGLPTGSTLLIKFGTLSLLGLVVARIGTEQAAAHQLLVVIANFVFIPAVAVGQSSIPFTARAAGKGSSVEVRRTVTAGYAVAVPVVAVALALLWALAGPVVGMFTSDPSVRETVIGLLPVVAAVVIADAVQALPGMGLLGLKRARYSMYTFAVCYGLLCAGAVPAAAAGGLAGVWIAYAVATAGLIVGQGVAFHRESARL